MPKLRHIRGVKLRVWGRIATLAGGGVLAGCSQMALQVPDTGRERPVSIIIPQSFPVAVQSVENYLKHRQHYKSSFRPLDRSGEVRVNQEWIRDVSLRYYQRLFDTRIRHLCAWRGQWILREISSTQTEARLKILEVIYMGLPQDAGPGPDPDNRANWYETYPDELRSSLELRRFWTSEFPTQALPAVLAAINVPKLDFPPLSAVDQKRGWKAKPRVRSF